MSRARMLRLAFARSIATWAMLCGALVATARAESWTACEAVHIRVRGTPAKRWLPVLAQACEWLQAMADGDSTAQVRVAPVDGDLAIEVVLPDGRSAERRVRLLAELRPTLEALLAIPPAQPLENSPHDPPSTPSGPSESSTRPAKAPQATPSTTPLSSPMSTPPTISEAPRASEPVPAPAVAPATAPVLARVTSPESLPKTAPAAASETRREEPPHATHRATPPHRQVEVGAMFGGRIAGPETSYSLAPTLLAQLRVGHWVLGFEGRWEFWQRPNNARREGYTMQTTAAGLSLARRMTFGAVGVDVGLGPRWIVETHRFAPRGQDPRNESVADARLAAHARLTLGRSSLAFLAGLDVEVSPTRVIHDVRLDPNAPALPSWSLGLGLGVLWASP